MNQQLNSAYTLGVNAALATFEKTSKDLGGAIGGTLLPGLGGAIGGGAQSGLGGAVGGGLGSLGGALLLSLLTRSLGGKVLASALGGGLGGYLGQKLGRKPEGIKEHLLGKY